jgi:transposase
MAYLARLALSGALTLAQLIDWVTRCQLRRHLGALPALYALLDTLQVRDIINRYCPSRAEVDHGTVAMVLILNRLTMPLPLYQVADWLAQTVLVYTLNVPAAKFNDDRLARTLDAIRPHCRDIWEAVVHRAMVQAKIDLSLIFYDLTAFIVHGTYADSRYVDFGFANNTPMNKRKFKTGLNVSADGTIPTHYDLWSGRTTDLATVEKNMNRLKRLLQRQGYRTEEVTLVGDRGTLSDKLALAYDNHNLRYLAGLRLLKKVHKALLLAVGRAALSPSLDPRSGFPGLLGPAMPGAL